ncbi:hypothetical protein [Lacticaseibacillus hulanensis]|jgi:predicted small lipoprotein YifL|uniref:hypothetical protein n=1 Tax=Lacticaseibacillus hulanensis TaxID=2493111 RepID=UPI000FD7F51C|nr:hypothetical protein [Lacticaseibacillus hulanensis]
MNNWTTGVRHLVLGSLSLLAASVLLTGCGQKLSLDVPDTVSIAQTGDGVLKGKTSAGAKVAIDTGKKTTSTTADKKGKFTLNIDSSYLTQTTTKVTATKGNAKETAKVKVKRADIERAKAITLSRKYTTSYIVDSQEIPTVYLFNEKLKTVDQSVDGSHDFNHAKYKGTLEDGATFKIGGDQFSVHHHAPGNSFELIVDESGQPTQVAREMDPKIAIEYYRLYTE